MSRFGWLGNIPAVGTERYAYSTIAKAVEIPQVYYGWSAPQLDQGSTPTCGPHAFVELYYTTMRQNGLEPILLDPFQLADEYAEYTGEPFNGVYNRLMMEVAVAYGYRVKTYHQVDCTKDEILNCLAEGYCFLVGIPVYQSFEDASTGLVPIPGKGDKWLGGHDVLIQGYDLDRDIVYGQNHWSGWGFEGHGFVGSCHFAMPFEYLTRLGSDAWTITIAT